MFRVLTNLINFLSYILIGTLKASKAFNEKKLHKLKKSLKQSYKQDKKT